MNDEPFAYPTRGKVETLLDTASPEVDPECLVSRYLEFEFHRSRQGDALAINGNLTERLKILHWYLTSYARHRKLPVPLSAKQIAFLNGPVPILGLGVEISIIAYSFITAEIGRNTDLRDDVALQESIFWWCAHKAPKLAPSGELITPAQIRLLTRPGPHDAGTRFPLNYFVRKLCETDPVLATLDLRATTDRAVLICILMLRCVDNPTYALFLPSGALAELIAPPSAGDPSLFESMVALAFGSSERTPPDQAATLRSLLVQALDRHGLSMGRTSRKLASNASGSGLFAQQDPNIRFGLEPGIAVIGPHRATSGIGQAMRVSVDVLSHAGRDPAVLDFPLDNPAPLGFATSRKTTPLRAPRQINLLHLNAESAPLAFAYLDKRIFSQSYNIGYFFWELNQVPKCHYLALDLLDEIWVSSEYNREIYSRVAKVPVINVGMAVEALPELALVSHESLGPAPGDFVFLATFDSFSFIERKNPLGLLRAFQAAFPIGAGEKVALILKTHNRTRVGDPHQLRIWQAIDDIVAGDPRVHVIDQTMSYRDLLGFKQACDCYVSLHRSEGLGFGLIEAMQLGLPVVTTAYSGNMEFCNPENCFLVDFELIPAMPGEYIFVERGSVWAEPSMSSAVEQLRRVFFDPAEAAARSARASSDLRRKFSVSRIAARYDDRLASIVSSFLTRPASS